MKKNIYDLVATELILRAGSGSSIGAYPALLTITSDIGSTEVMVGYNENHSFTSVVENIPTGYTISPDSHVMTYPSSADTIGSAESISTTGVTVNIGSTLGGTYVVTSSVTLVNLGDTSQPDIILTGTMTITSVLPLYYGVKAYTDTPSTLLGLETAAYSSTSFTLYNTILGRLYIGLPTTLSPLISITDSNGMIITADKFTLISNTSEYINYFILNHDTQLTGLNSKKFTINFS